MAAVMACDAADGIPVAAGVAGGVAMGQTSQARGDLYTMADMRTYVVPPRDPTTFDGRALLILPDMTGVTNKQNQQLAGTSRPPSVPGPAQMKLQCHNAKRHSG